MMESAEVSVLLSTILHMIPHLQELDNVRDVGTPITKIESLLCLKNKELPFKNHLRFEETTEYNIYAFADT